MTTTRFPIHVTMATTTHYANCTSAVAAVIGYVEAHDPRLPIRERRAREAKAARDQARAVAIELLTARDGLKAWLRSQVGNDECMVPCVAEAWTGEKHDEQRDDAVLMNLARLQTAIDVLDELTEHHASMERINEAERTPPAKTSEDQPLKVAVARLLKTLARIEGHGRVSDLPIYRDGRAATFVHACLTPAFRDAAPARGTLADHYVKPAVLRARERNKPLRTSAQ